MTPIRGLKQRWFGNSFVNVVGGVGSAAVNLLLPAVVAKYLSPDEFSLWSLALQIIIYVNLLGLGLQLATARAVSYAGDAGASAGLRNPVIAQAARSISRKASGLAVMVIVVLVVTCPLLFPSVPQTSITEFRIVLGLFGLVGVAQIFSQPDMGVFQGLHRYLGFVGPKMSAQILGVFLVWLGVQAHQPIVVLALLLAAGMSLLWPAMRLAVRHSVTWGRDIGSAVVDKACRWELLQYCGALSVMSISMLVVNTAGVLVVGRIDFQMTGAYAIAMTAATVPVGLLGAALSPLLTTGSAMYASPETRARLPKLTTLTTVILTVGLNVFLLGIELLYPQILRLWVGERFVFTAGPLLVILVAAHCLRNVAAPYSLMLLAAGLHRRALYTAVLEGTVNLAASIVLGIRYGALGVAFGALIGSLVGVAGCLIFNTGRTPEITPRPFRFSLGGITLPILIFMPLHLYVLHLFN
ncbi:MAG: hypothetical protein EPN72_02340 [Nevskiaceae bacterium]|nr:MAG: hypothetical protein EPN63_13090 [Nevskiaceae bacterium]TBR74861.1 MAG: hypothetical protein EPN72_02340 [Nevskiaceae bacterium]